MRRLDASRRWKPLPLKGELPPKSPDHHGLAYDSKRDRLLFFSDLGKTKGDVAAYDVRSGGPAWYAGKYQKKYQHRAQANGE